jgi:hypothetical protein
MVVYSDFAAYGASNPSISEEVLKEKDANLNGDVLADNLVVSGSTTHQEAISNPVNNSAIDGDDPDSTKRGIVLSFVPLSLTFDDIRYFVDMPEVPNKRNCFLFC